MYINAPFFIVERMETVLEGTVPPCGDTSPPVMDVSFGCTRPRGHIGLHVALGDSEFCAAWDDESKTGEQLENGRDARVAEPELPTKPTEAQIKAARELLDPMSFRVIKRAPGFTVEVPVVDYWDAVKTLAIARGSEAQKIADWLRIPDWFGVNDGLADEVERVFVKGEKK